MTREQAAKVFSRLAAAHPGFDIPPETAALWIDCLKILFYESAMNAVTEYIMSPKESRFPLPGDIFEIYDRHELARRNRQRQENDEMERKAIRRLFHDPTTNWPDDYARKSVELIRDLCAGRIKTRTPEYRQRFDAIYPGYRNWDEEAGAEQK